MSKASKAAGVEWVAGWVPLSKVQRMADLQVRYKLDAGTVKRYRDAHASGAEFPPIKVARLKSGALFLVDGWHRMAAGALLTSEDTFGTGEEQVWAEVADLTEAGARWEAAQANIEHGLPLKRRELREVFRAFVKAGKHRKAGGGYLSYREMGALLNKPHTGVYDWMRKDFPAIFARIGGNEGGNREAGPAEVESFAEVQRREGLAAVQAVHASLATMTPQGRWEVSQAIQQTLREADRLGLEEPIPPEF